MSIVIRGSLSRAIVAALPALGMSLTTPSAEAVTLVWQNAAGGPAGVAANWNPAQVPTDADVLRFDLANAYTVTFGAAVDSVVSHHLWGGDVTIDCAVTHGGKNQFYVASQAGQVATARLTSGTLRMGTFARVGSGLGAIGTLRVNGGSTNLLQNDFGAEVMDIGGDDVSSGGTGEVVVLGGGVVELADRLNLGRSAGGTGALRVRGLGDTGGGLRRSHFFADNATSDCRVGMEGGHGILEVLDGGLFRVGRDLLASPGPADISEITVGGENLIDSSEVHVKDDLRLCVNPSVLGGGTGTILVDSLGVLVVDDSTVVGDPDGSSGLLTIRPHARMITKHLILQQPTGGSVDFQGGLLQVDGGMLATGTNRLAIPGGSTSIALRPSLELLNGATASFSGTLADPPLVVGETGGAEIRVKGGSQLTATGSRSILGKDGLGLLYVEDGGVGTLDGLDLGIGASGRGSLIVRDAGSVLTLTGPLNVAGTTLTAGNDGSVLIANDGVLNLNAPLVAGTVWPPASGTGDLEVFSDGRVNLTSTLTVRGILNMVGGEVAGGSIALRGIGSIIGEGSVQSGILGGADTTVSIAVTNDPGSQLEIGRDTSGGDVLMRGLLDVGAGSLTVHDPDSAVVGVVDLAGGELRLPAGGGVIETDKRLTGEGTIHGPLVNRGYLISSGASGLRFAGTLYGTGQGVGGDQLVFLSGGGFEGAGTIDAKVQADSGSLIRATGTLSAGHANIAGSLVLNGRIETGANLVLLYNFGPTDIRGELVLDGGRVAGHAAFTVNVHQGGRLQGRGTLAQLVNVYNSGTIAPGNSAGRLEIEKGFVLNPAGTLEVELGNHAAGEADTLSVSAGVTLAGDLALRRLPTFAAAAGDSFKIIDCSWSTGAFTNVTLDGAPLAGELEVHYAADGIWIVILQPVVGVGDDDEPGSPRVSHLQLATMGSPGERPGVELALPSAASVALHVYDIHGRRVSALHDGALGAGRHRFQLSRDPGGAGMFFVRAIVTEGGTTSIRTTRVVRLR